MMNKEILARVEDMTRMKMACSRLYNDPKDTESMKELQNLINNATPTAIRALEPMLFPIFFNIFKSIEKDRTKFKEHDLQQLDDTMRAFFEKTTISRLPLFFNIYGFLLFELYDPVQNKVLNISEEYKLSLIQCMTALAKCLSSSAVKALYVKDNAPKLCQMIYAVLQIAKNEDFKTLRIAAINCIMAIAHVLDDHDFNDVVMRDQIAEVFLFFLPGVATQLRSVVLIDEKFGHKVPTVALKAWGRIVVLLMQNYKASDQKMVLHQEIKNVETKSSNKTVWKDEAELKEYIKSTQRSPRWYKETDKNLQQIIIEFAKLTHHSHPKVRLEVVHLAELVIENCVDTMPTSVGHLIDIVIILSEDEDDSVRSKSQKILDTVSKKLAQNEFKSLLDNLEENFYSVMTSIPRKFNGIDDRIKMVAINSLIGYINLFGKHNLSRVLHSAVHLNRLLLTLIHISDFDKSDVSILEEYTTTDYDMHKDLKIPWKKFRHFEEVTILKKIETVCRLLAKFGASSIVTDFLLNVISTESEQRKEAIFLLNEVVSGLERNENETVFKNVVNTYTDGIYWYLPLSVMIDDYGYEHTLSDVQDNILQVSLLVEGIGKIALALGKNFQLFLLKTLYLVLERAGSSHPVIRSAGLESLLNLSKACGYLTITDLINDNIDYFSFHIERKLNRGKEDTGGLDVLAVVIKYSTKEVLHSTCEVVRELLLRTCDETRTNLNSYLHIFKMFICGLHKWLNIEPIADSFKTKKQKEEEFENFKVSNTTPIEDFSDEIMGKTAEEMYKEDMGKNRQQLEEEINAPAPEEYDKPEIPTHVKLTVAILTRSLHYLPSKHHARKLLVLEILKNGLPLVRDFEDELLPIVHLIWGPLVDRFKEDDPLIVNFSLRLLVVLAKLSKEFIRSRTAKDVLPSILTKLDSLARESYLKDKGSAYRYSQNYKLQLTILGDLARIVTDLDMLEQDFDKSMGVVFKYLSDKQPIPLQECALLFFKMLLKYDPKFVQEKFTSLTADVASEYGKNTGLLRGHVE